MRNILGFLCLLPGLLFADAASDRNDVACLVTLLGDKEPKIRAEAEEKLEALMEWKGGALWRHLASLEPPESHVTRFVSGTTSLELQDAKGEAMSNVVCRIFKTDARNTFLGRAISSPEGTVLVPALEVGKTLKLEIYDPLRGAVTSIYRGGANVQTFPLVRANVAEAQRAARGRIVDAAGKPVPHVRIFGGVTEFAGQRFGMRHHGSVMTDAEGRFRFYSTRTFILEEHADWRMPKKVVKDPAIPAGSSFDLSFTRAGFFPHREMVENRAKETVIRLAKGQKFHRFTFESGRTAMASVLYIPKDASAPPVPLAGNDVRNGRLLIPGRYRATLKELNERRTTNPLANFTARQYVDLHVGPESPEELLFVHPRVSGRVLAAKGKSPITNAVVFTYNHHEFHYRSPGLGLGSWIRVFPGQDQRSGYPDVLGTNLTALAATPAEEMMTHPTTSTLKRFLPLHTIGKTDANGHYNLPIRLEGKFSLVVLAPGMFRNDQLVQPGEQLAPIRLRPSARIRFTAQIPKGETMADRRLKLWEKDRSKWIELDPYLGVCRNGVCEAILPANNKMELVAGLGHERSQISLKSVSLKPGARVDFGPRRVLKAVPVEVRLLAQDGNSLVGVSIEHRYLRGPAGQRTRTGHDGEANFRLAPGVAGEFTVLDRNGETTAAFPVTAASSQPKIEIRLSEKQEAARKKSFHAAP